MLLSLFSLHSSLSFHSLLLFFLFHPTSPTSLPIHKKRLPYIMFTVSISLFLASFSSVPHPTSPLLCLTYIVYIIMIKGNSCHSVHQHQPLFFSPRSPFRFTLAYFIFLSSSNNDQRKLYLSVHQNHFFLTSRSPLLFNSLLHLPFFFILLLHFSAYKYVYKSDPRKIYLSVHLNPVCGPRSIAWGDQLSYSQSVVQFSTLALDDMQG